MSVDALLGVGLLALLNLVGIAYTYGRLSSKVDALGNHLSDLTRRTDNLSERISRLEGQLGRGESRLSLPT